jgi:hypothetical protein
MKLALAPFLLIIVAMAAACCGPARADRLVLQGGDAFSGRLIEIQEGMVLFETSLAGLSIVPVHEAEGLTTDRYFRVTFQDGEQIVGRFQQTDEAIELRNIADKPVGPVRLDEIQKTTSIEAELLERLKGLQAAEEDNEMVIPTGYDYWRRYAEAQRQAPEPGGWWFRPNPPSNRRAPYGAPDEDPAGHLRKLVPAGYDRESDVGKRTHNAFGLKPTLLPRAPRRLLDAENILSRAWYGESEGHELVSPLESALKHPRPMMRLRLSEEPSTLVDAPETAPLKTPLSLEHAG